MKCCVKGRDIHYEARGEGRPLVMLHGFCIDHRSLLLSLDDCFDDREGWQRIYPDLPGMGASPPNPEIQNSDDMLSVISEFIDQVVPDKHYSLFGYSYGGYLTQGLVRNNPERIKGVGLLCPAVIASQELRILPKFFPVVQDETFLKTLSEAERADFEALAVVRTRESWQRVQDEIQIGLNAMDQEFISRLSGDAYGFSFPVFPLEHPFEKPALIVTGRQDNVVGYADSLELLESYSRASFSILDKAGHNLQIEQSELLKKLFVEWLSRIEEAG